MPKRTDQTTGKRKGSATKKAAKPAGKSTAAKKRRVAAPRAVEPKEAGEKGVNSVSRVDLFIREYLIDLNGRQAAIRAGYSPQSARQTASELLATTAVQQAVTKAMVERAQRTGITADQVLERFWGIATADPGEMVEHIRCCCRYCWGQDHLYQFTPRELHEARRQHQQAELEAKAEKKKLLPFDELGGVGYDPRKDPHPNCPECFGQGEERVFFKDTRDLSPSARLLYAGVKTTQHGLEIKTHDQMSALVNVGKHLGMFKEKVELTGKDGADLGMGVVVLPPRGQSAEVTEQGKAEPTKVQEKPPRGELKITAVEE